MTSKAILFIAAVLCGPVWADSALRTFETGVDTQGWEAVGRLDFAGRSFCTGALISDTEVLTAAHCVLDEAGTPFGAREVTFRLGWRNGHAQAYRTAKRVTIHPDFDLAGAQSARMSADLAIVELDHPVRDGRIKPLPTSGRLSRGDAVGVVSYAQGRSDTPSLQEVCHVIARQAGVIITTCDVDSGSSGAPVFVLHGGQPVLVSVVSAKAEFKGRKVSVGAMVETALDDLLAAARTTGRRFFQRVDHTPLSGDP